MHLNTTSTPEGFLSALAAACSVLASCVRICRRNGSSAADNGGVVPKYVSSRSSKSPGMLPNPPDLSPSGMDVLLLCLVFTRVARTRTSPTNRRLLCQRPNANSGRKHYRPAWPGTRHERESQQTYLVSRGC